MKERTKSIQELKDTRIKATFKVEIEVELPYLDKNNYLNMHLRDVLEEITNKVANDNTDGHITNEDTFKEHKVEAFYGVEEEEEWNIHDWDI